MGIKKSLFWVIYHLFPKQTGRRAASARGRSGIPACSWGFRSAPAHGATLATLHRSFPAAAGAFYPLPSTSRHLAERDYPSLRHSPNPGAAREVTTQGFFLQSASLSGKPGTTFVFSLLSPQRKCPRDQLQNSGVTTPTELLRPAVTGHKTPRLFVPAAGATLRVGTDPTPRGDIPNL